jgi:hypothetical protein
VECADHAERRVHHDTWRMGAECKEQHAVCQSAWGRGIGN